MSSFYREKLPRMLVAFGLFAIVGARRKCAGHHAPESFAARPSIPTAVMIPDGTDPYAGLRAAHPTHLVRHGASPQRYEDFTPTLGVIDTYESQGLRLKIWVVRPPGDEPKPVLVYAHGGWALGPSDFDDARAAYDAGMVVVLPTLRGENGNPGDFEMAFGEVDDLRAALRYAAELPDVDRSRIYLVGHSAGGMIASLAALYPESPVALTASIGGVYSPSVIATFGDTAPFDTSVADECRFRSMLPFAGLLAHTHVAYTGEDDAGMNASAGDIRAALVASRGMLEHERVPGDHFASLRPAMERFVRRIQQAEGAP